MNEEAMRHLQHCIRWEGSEPDVDALKIAIEALKKQVSRNTRHTSFGTECSVCGSLVVIRGCARFSYCPYCGQRICWEEN